MGITQSLTPCDYDNYLLNYTGDEVFQVGPADDVLDLSPIFRSTHNGTDPNTPLMTGLRYDQNDPNSKQTHSLWELFQIGKSIAGNDFKCLGVRTFKVPKEPIIRTEAELVKLGPKYKPSGYIERDNGIVERYEYEYITFQETEDLSLQFIRGLISFGYEPNQTRVAVFMPNRPEYYLTAFGCWSHAIPIIPLYTTLGVGSIATTFTETEAEVVVLTKDNVATVVQVLEQFQRENIPISLKHIIVCDSLLNGRFGDIHDTIDPSVVDTLRTKLPSTITIINFSQVLQIGSQIEATPLPTIEQDTLSYIMYTSGTTSENNRVKGVELTHGGFASCVGASRFIIPIKAHQPVLSLLPLAHVFQVCIDLSLLSAGGYVCFSSGDIRNLPSDLIAAQPYCIPIVPRIAQRFFSGIFDKVSQASWIKRWYFYRAANYQINQLRNEQPLDETYDTYVFKTVRETMGLGNCKLMLISAAPVPGLVLEFMRTLLGPGSSCLLGYGLTESHAGLSTSKPGVGTCNHIGTPIVSAEFRIKSIPDMGYAWQDENPRGELLIRGNSITKGYFKNPEENEKAFLIDSNGSRWYQTGDIVRMNKKSGTLTIIDRRKNCLKLSQGEYVAQERLIVIYSQSNRLSQVFPYGNSFKSSMVAIIVPNILELYNYAKAQNWWTIDEQPSIGALTQSVKDECVRIGTEYQDKLVTWIREGFTPYEKDLNPFEKIKAFYVDTNYQDDLGLVFCEANGLLTPTMKLKTKPLAMFYQAKLEQLYDSINEPTLPGQPWW